MNLTFLILVFLLIQNISCIEILQPGESQYNLQGNQTLYLQFTLNPENTGQIQFYLKGSVNLNISAYIRAIDQEMDYAVALRQVQGLSQGLTILDLMDFELESFCSFAKDCSFLAEFTSNQVQANQKLQIYLNYIYKDQFEIPQYGVSDVISFQTPVWEDKQDSVYKQYFDAIYLYRVYQILNYDDYAILNLRYNNLGYSVLVKSWVQDDGKARNYANFKKNSLTVEDAQNFDSRQQEFQALQLSQEVFECQNTGSVKCEVYISVYIQQKKFVKENKVYLQLLRTLFDQVPKIQINNQKQTLQNFQDPEKQIFQTYLIDTSSLDLQKQTELSVNLEGCFSEQIYNEFQQTLCKWKLCFYSFSSNQLFCEQTRTVSELYPNTLTQQQEGGFFFITIFQNSYPEYITIGQNLTLTLGDKTQVPVLRDSKMIKMFLEQRNFFIFQLDSLPSNRESVQLYSLYETEQIVFRINFCSQIEQCSIPTEQQAKKIVQKQKQNPVYLVNTMETEYLTQSQFMFVQVYNSSYVQEKAGSPTFYSATTYTILKTQPQSDSLDGTQITGIIFITLMGVTIIAGAAYYFYKKKQDYVVNDYESAQSEN